jgi:hypothetical protein
MLQPANHQTIERSDASTDALLCALIVGFPVAYAVQGLLGTPDGLLTLVSRMATLALAAIVFARRLRSMSHQQTFYCVALIAFLVHYGSTMFVSLILNLEQSVAPPSVMFGLFIGVSVLPSFVIVACGVDYRSRETWLLKLLFVIVTTFIAVAVYNGRELLGTQYGRFKVEGGINQIYLGHMAVLNLYVIYFLSTAPDARLNRITKAFMFLGGLLSMMTIVAAGSRGPVVGLFVVGCYMFWAQMRKAAGLVTSMGVMVVAAFAIIFLDPQVFYEYTGSSLLLRLTETEDLSSEGRLTIYRMGLEKFAESPIWGGSLLVMNTYPHNFIIEVLMATGLIGLTFFLAFYVPALVECLAAARRARVKWFHVFFIHMSVTFSFSGSVWGMHLLWTALALVLAHLCMRRAHSFAGGAYARKRKGVTRRIAI